MNTIVVSALYKFVSLPNFERLKNPLFALMQRHGIKGTILLAKEGVNGTVAGTAAAIEELYNWFEKQPGLNNISHKESYHLKRPFNRTKVKLKKEIVTLGVEEIDPQNSAGTYVKPHEWNQLINSDDVTVIDTRNNYEVEIGTFQGALNPNTKTFKEFPEYVKLHLDPKKHKKIAMFCTGGIRCEKSTAYLKHLGFDEVYHLEGGILKYLEEVPEENSLWEGECFVFDDRVTVNHDLQKGDYDQCHACRFPIKEADKLSSDYVSGVSCPRCIGTHSSSQLQRFSEREKQNQLAKAKGEMHIGEEATQIMLQRRLQKRPKNQVSN